jgi:hypothetical protein
VRADFVAGTILEPLVAERFPLLSTSVAEVGATVERNDCNLRKERTEEMNTTESTKETVVCSNCFRQECDEPAARTFVCAKCGEPAHKCSDCYTTTGNGETCAMCEMERDTGEH